MRPSSRPKSLTEADRAFLLRHSFYSDPQRMIYRYPRYGELFDAWQGQKRSGSRNLFGPQDFRDLQMWSQLAWFDEEFQAQDPEVREWVAARARLHAGRPAPHGREAARDRGPGAAGVSEAGGRGPDRDLDHAVLPSHPAAAVRFEHRRRGASQRAAAAAVPLSRRCAPPARPGARVHARSQFGAAPVGLWPSEGSVSDEVFAIASELGFEWAATDSGVLNRTLGRAVPVDGLYRPYCWRQGGKTLNVIFRDHFLSDLIGFVYSKMDAAAGGRGFSAAHPRKLRAAFWPRRARRAGAHHPRRRECLGILRPQRPAVPARAVPADLGGPADARRDRERGPAAAGAGAARPHLSGIVDQRQFRRLDRGRGRQPGLDATAARAAGVRFRRRGPRRRGGGWLSRNC